MVFHLVTIWQIGDWVSSLYQIISDQISRSVASDSLRPHESQHARPPCPSPTPGVHWDSRPSSQWCHPAISSSVLPFFCPQSLPAFESLPLIIDVVYCGTFFLRRQKYQSFHWYTYCESLLWILTVLIIVEWKYLKVVLGAPMLYLGFPGGSEDKVFACNAGDPGSIPGLGRSPGEGNGNPLQYSCLENPMDRGAWRTTVHRVAKSQTRLSDFTFFHGICSFKTGNI